MKALTNNTLIEISRHSNKVLKLATYMAKSEQPMLLDNIYMIESNTDQKTALESFQKDFDKTVDLIEKSHQLLSTVNSSGIVEQLDNNEQNLKNIFDDKYDSVNFELNLSSIKIPLEHDISKDYVRNEIMYSVLEISYSEFRDFIKNVDKIYKLDERNLESEEDAVEYLSTLAYREKYDLIIDKIKDVAGKFSDYRKNLGLENRNLIDNEITFTRSMIDSIMKNSTYITKDGIEQISNPHKKNMDLVNQLHHFIIDNNYISGLELDPDTNLKSVLDILIKTEDLNLNIKELFVLKCRKLGNYNANGLYIPKMHIAAVDITNPSALIHELTHAVDISNKDLYGHILREEMVNKYKQKIDTADLHIQKKIRYYLDGDEIIARLGEIAYILNKNKYTGNESMPEFLARVSIEEKQYNSEYLNIAKPINTYLERANVYFNFNTLEPSDLLEIKEYFSSYFGVNNDEIKPVYSNYISYEQKETKKARKVSNKYKDSPFVKLDPISIVKALDYNYENKLIPFNQFFLSIAENIDKIARKKNTLTVSSLDTQLKTTQLMYDWVANKNDVNLKVDLIKNMYILSKGIYVSNYFPFKLAFQFAGEESFNKINSLMNAANSCGYIKAGQYSLNFRKHHREGLKKVVHDVSFEDLLKRLDLTDTLSHSFLFSRNTLREFNEMKGENWTDKYESMLAIYKDGEPNKIFNKILNISAVDDYMAFDKEKSDYVLENVTTSFKYGLRSAKENEELLAYSLSAGNFSIKESLSSIERIKGNNVIKKHENDNGYDVCFENISVPNILGKDKVVSENFKEIRIKLLEKSLEELKLKQSIEIKKVPEVKSTSITETLKSKINEEVNSKKEIEKPTPQKPIIADKNNQFKLF